MFDPNVAAGADSGIFGLPHTPAQALVHVVPVPFDATTSYRKGAAQGPAAVLRASRQVDLHDLLFGDVYACGIALLPEDPRVAAWNAEASGLAQPIIDAGGDLGGDAARARDLARVNRISRDLDDLVEAQVGAALDAARVVAVLGGDHAVPLGAFRAAAARHRGIGLLHFDAHCDLRAAYEGFERSHASILHNALEQVDGIAHVMQVGIRDVCAAELDYARAQRERVSILFDHEWAAARMEGKNLRELVRATLRRLPQTVWVTFDVDALDPALCPNTGTPVPGGLSYPEASLWLQELAASGRRVIGCDLVEVSPGRAAADEDSYDAMVGARVLYRLIGAATAAARG